MRHIVLNVQYAIEGGVLAAQAIQEVLGKDPPNVAVDCFLHTQLIGLKEGLEGRGGQAVEE